MWTSFKYLCPVLIKSENLKAAAIRSRSIGRICWRRWDGGGFGFGFGFGVSQ